MYFKNTAIHHDTIPKKNILLTYKAGLDLAHIFMTVDRLGHDKSYYIVFVEESILLFQRKVLIAKFR